MAAKLVDITNYTPKSSDIFFFDNNIWMYIYTPLVNYNKYKQKHYSSFLQSITSSRSTIFISSMILSEFSNRNLRMDFELWKDETENYSAEFKKDYFPTKRYKETVEEIKSYINQIMKNCIKTSDNFNAIELKDVLAHFSHIDFNDSYILELAKIDKLKIVTDDDDFSKYTNHNLEIFTIPN